MIKKITLIVVLLAVALVIYFDRSELERENDRLYMALKCVYRNIDSNLTPEKIADLEYAVFRDLLPHTTAAWLVNDRKDVAGGCYDRFGLDGKGGNRK